MKDGKGEFDLPQGIEFIVDPDGWILMKSLK